MNFEKYEGLPPMPVTGVDKPIDEVPESEPTTQVVEAETPAAVENTAEKRRENLDAMLDFYKVQVRASIQEYLDASGRVYDTENGGDERTKRRALVEFSGKLTILMSKCSDIIRSDADMPTDHFLRHIFGQAHRLLSNYLIDAPDASHDNSRLDDGVKKKIKAGRFEWKNTREAVLRFRDQMEGALLFRESL